MAAAMLAVGAPALAQQPGSDAPVPTARYERPPPPPAYTPPPPPPYAPLDVPNSPIFRRSQTVTPVPAPPPQQAQAAPASPPVERAARPSGGRTVEMQIGAFADRANAEKAARAVRAAGASRIVTTTVGGKTWHRVIVGPGPERELRATLARLGFKDARAL